MTGKIVYQDGAFEKSRCVRGHVALVQYLVDSIGSQTALAKKIGVHRNSIIKWLRGEEITIKHLRQLIDLVTINDEFSKIKGKVQS